MYGSTPPPPQGEIEAIGKLKLNLTEVGQFKTPLEAMSYTRSKTQEITQ